MPRTPENLPRHELIGLEVTVEEHPDPGIEGLTGTVVDETRNFFEIDGRKVEKKGLFVFNLEGEDVEISADLIRKRPEDRVSMYLPEDFSGR